MELKKFYELINKNAFVTLATEDLSKTLFEGALKDIPDEFGTYTVKDFCTSDEGDFLFKLQPCKKAPVQNNLWKEGRVEIRGITFHYWVKQYEEGSKNGINGSRVSKLTIRNERTGNTVANYERGWDVKPKTKTENAALDYILKEFN